MSVAHTPYTDKASRRALLLPATARLKKVLIGSVQEWFAQRGASKGAALAFYTLFSMAPVLVLVIAIAGAIFGEDAAAGAIYTQLNGLVGPSGAEAIQGLVASANKPGSGLVATIIATSLLVLGATTVFAELKASLDEIWHVPKSKASGIFQVFRTRLMSLSVVVVLAFLLLASLVISAALALLERFLGGIWAEASSILQPASTLISFSVIACMFAVIFKILPQVRLAWRDVWIGALGTAVLFIVGKYLIGIYLGNSAVADSYGAAGSVVALLLWIYYSAQIFFLGAGFTRQYALWFGSFKDRNPEIVTADKQAAPALTAVDAETAALAMSSSRRTRGLRR